MDYESWLTWLAQFDRRMSFAMQHLRAALPDVTRSAHAKHVERAVAEGRVRRATYSNGVQRYQMVRDVSTGGE
jgi:3-phenylpropionate/cinnamic acid dioxygenase small subunit